jgi:hypothetical protein
MSLIGESTKTVWYGITYKRPKKYIAGVIPGTIPGFYGESRNIGFFVPAQDQESALKQAKRLFTDYRRSYGEHALTAAQVNALDLTVKRLTKAQVGEEELGLILEKSAKIGDKARLYGEDYTVIRVVKRGANKKTKNQFPSDYLPKNISNWDEVINPENTEKYTVVRYL